MQYTRAMKVPVLLVIVGVTFMLCGQVSTSCSCSGYVTSKGRGECRTFYRGKKFCYVNPGQCSDQIKASSSNRFWSYQACEKMEQQVSTSCSCSGYVTSKGRGECRTFYRGKKFCYVNPGQCPDQIKGSSPLLPNRFWSYQACEKMEQQCYTVRGNQCQFPFSYKGRTFSSCTTFDSENRAAWCTTKEGRYEDCVSHLPPVLETQLSRNLAGTVAQRTTPVGRERGTVTQTTRTPVRQVSGAETQTAETSTLPTMPQRTAAISRSTKGSITMSLKMAT
eukprot:GFUD01126861.1.p1 GENE.GFUD01126861.1~~GFUD01126861.1.p1  ORF type:complete len:278 (-),score=60.73 GFUD01126861.1:364-1197(-)